MKYFIIFAYMNILKKKKLKVPIYSFAEITVFICKDMEQFKKDNNITDAQPYDALFLYKPEDPGYYAIALTEDASHGVIAHECFHAVCGILKTAGSNLSYDSEEPYAYFLTWLVDEVYKILVK